MRKWWGGGRWSSSHSQSSRLIETQIGFILITNMLLRVLLLISYIPSHYIQKPPLGTAWATLKTVAVVSKHCSRTDPMLKSCYCYCRHWNPSSVLISLMVANDISRLAEQRLQNRRGSRDLTLFCLWSFQSQCVWRTFIWCGQHFVVVTLQCPFL